MYFYSMIYGFDVIIIMQSDLILKENEFSVIESLAV